jgi:hypothetical protein
MEISAQEMAKAKEVYASMCKVLEDLNWKHEQDQEKMCLRFTVRGDDIPMSFVLYVDPKPGFIRLISWLPFEITKEKMIDAAVATCAINFRLKNGTFDFDLSDGSIGFRLSQAYFDSSIGNDVLKHMVFLSCHIVDEYNDKYMMLSKGSMSLKDFLDFING